MSNCVHILRIEKRGKYFLIKCERCGSQWRCPHVQHEKILMCKDCMKELVKDNDRKRRF